MAQENQISKDQIDMYKSILEDENSPSASMVEALSALSAAGEMTEDEQREHFAKIQKKIADENREADENAEAVVEHGETVSDMLDSINPLDERNEKFFEFRQKMDAIRIYDENGEELVEGHRASAIQDMVDAAKLSLTKDLLSNREWMETENKEEIIEDFLAAKLQDAQIQIGMQYESFLPATEEELENVDGLNHYAARVEKDYNNAWEKFKHASWENPVETHIGSLASYYANAVNESEAWFDKMKKTSSKAAKHEQLAKHHAKVRALDERIKNNPKYGKVYEAVKSITKSLWANKKSIAKNIAIGVAATTALTTLGWAGAVAYTGYVVYSKIHKPIENEYKDRLRRNPEIKLKDVYSDCFKMLTKKQTEPKNKALKAKLWGGVVAAGLGGLVGIGGGAIASTGVLEQSVSVAATKLGTTFASGTGAIIGSAKTIKANNELLKSDDGNVDRQTAKKENIRAWSEIVGAAAGMAFSGWMNRGGFDDVFKTGGESIDSVALPSEGSPEITDTTDINDTTQVAPVVPKPEITDTTGIDNTGGNDIVDNSVVDNNEYDLPTKYDAETMKGISARQFNTLFNHANIQFIGGQEALETAYGAAKSMSPEHLAALGMRSPEELVYKFSRLEFFLGHNKDGSLCVSQFTDAKLNLEQVLNCEEIIQEGGRVTPQDLAGMRDLLSHIDQSGHYHGPGDHYVTYNAPNGGTLNPCDETNVPHYKAGGRPVINTPRPTPVPTPAPEPQPQPVRIEPLDVKPEPQPFEVNVPEPVIDVPPLNSWGPETPIETVVNVGESSENGHWGRDNYLITQIVNATQKEGTVAGEHVVNISGKLADGTEFSESTFDDGRKVFGVKVNGADDWRITEVEAGKEGIINGNAAEYLRVRDSFNQPVEITGEGVQNGHWGSSTIAKGVVVHDQEGHEYVSKDDVNYQVGENGRIVFNGNPENLGTDSHVRDVKELATGEKANGTVSTTQINVAAVMTKNGGR